MLVHRAEMLDIECIVRGYLAGSACKEYQREGTVHGMAMPAGLRHADRLPEPIFTPSTKATEGHDLNIGMAEAIDLVGKEAAEAASELCLAAYRRAAARAEEQGIVICDTKFELGFIDGALSICDEVLTPDSSRFWPADDCAPGDQPAVLRQAAAARLARGPALGQAAPARRLCPTRSWRPPRSGTSTPTSGSAAVGCPTGTVPRSGVARTVLGPGRGAAAGGDRRS